MSGKTPTLAEALAAARRLATVLDDGIEIDDKTVFHWLRGHQLHLGHYHYLVVGSQALPAAWQARTLKFTSERAALDRLRPVARDRVAMTALQSALSEAGIAPAPSPKATTATPTASTAIDLAAKALVAGQLWAIEARHAPPSRFISRTSPSVFAAINPLFGTAIDFQYIATLEGNQWLRGYVPFKRGGIVAGRSGMTVASGFDVGQWSLSQLGTMGFPSPLLDKLKPFANVNFKSRDKSQVAAQVATLGPVPVLTKAEADLCDGRVFSAILGQAQKAWDTGHSAGVPAFTALPAGWQTVWLSRYYQEGPATRVALGKTFRAQALAGKWADAVTSLRSYTEYGARAKAEANVLAAALPPAPSPPAKATK
jgi:hypothetical protein